MTTNKITKSGLANKWPLVVLGYIPLIAAFAWRAQYETLTASSSILLQHSTNLIYSYGIVLSLLLYESRRQWVSLRTQVIIVSFMVLINVIIELFVKVGDIHLNTPFTTFSFENFNTVIPDYGDLVFGLVGIVVAFVFFRFVILPRDNQKKRATS